MTEMTPRDRVLAGEVVKLSDARLAQMHRIAIAYEDLEFPYMHWHWRAAINELIAARKEIEHLTGRLAELEKERDQRKDRRDSGWLIENGKAGHELRYRTMEQGFTAWTEDHQKAIRFARREDAEMFCAEDMEAWRIAEHVWLAASSSSAGAAR